MRLLPASPLSEESQKVTELLDWEEPTSIIFPCYIHHSRIKTKRPNQKRVFESYPNKYRYNRKHDDDDGRDDKDEMDDLDDFFDDADYTTGVLYRKGKNVIIKLSNERNQVK